MQEFQISVQAIERYFINLISIRQIVYKAGQCMCVNLRWTECVCGYLSPMLEYTVRISRTEYVCVCVNT
jgi:hypothetical protein